MKLSWKDGENQNTQPIQRPLQVRCNGKNSLTDLKYTLVRGIESNEIIPSVVSIPHEIIIL